MIVEKLTHNLPNLSSRIQKDFLYFDIETTGLQKKNALIYLIGCLRATEDGTCQIYQWFAENPDQEKDIIKEFLTYADSFQGFCHFNGNRFDLPFLEYRAQLYEMPSPFQGKISRDLYQLYKPMQSLLGLSRFRQKDLEEYLRYTREDPYSGKDCIKIYRDLIKYRDLSYAEPLLLHNREDLLGLTLLESLEGYDLLGKNTAVPEEITRTKEGFTARLHLSFPLPRPIQGAFKEWVVKGFDQTLEVRVDLTNGCLKNYYPNYSDYYYLPGEDTVIHKSVGTYLEKSLRQKATPHNCYTRFFPQEDFFNNTEQMESYISKNLPLILSFFSS